MLETLSLFTDKIAIVHRGDTFTYGQLLQKIHFYRDIYLTHIPKKSCVAIVSDYSIDAIALFLALAEKQTIIVPLASTLANEIDEKISIAQCNYAIRLNDEIPLITEYQTTSLHPMLATLHQLSHAGLILFSSGSTGKPKAMVHDLSHLFEHYDAKKPKNLVMLLFLMFDHIGGLNTMLNILSMGATMVIPENRNPEHICDLIERYRIAVLPSSPTFLNLIIMSGAWERYDLSSLRMITYGTETMPESLLLKLKTIFPKIKFLQTFGTSETGIATTSSKSSDSTLMRIEDASFEYKIIDGTLWLKSDTQVLGYLNASMESFQEGWFNTGDLVEVSVDGFLRIIGRSKEVINVGGQKLMPSEVESIILMMPQIQDCMVSAKPNAITGQSVAVEVVLKNPHDEQSIKKMIRAFCKEHLENYKIPTHVSVVEQTNFSDRFKKMRLS